MDHIPRLEFLKGPRKPTILSAEFLATRNDSLGIDLGDPALNRIVGDGYPQYERGNRDPQKSQSPAGALDRITHDGNKKPHWADEE